MVQAVFFDVGNTLLQPYPSVARVCQEVLRNAGHERALSDIERHMPLVDQYYEDAYRADDTFWTDEERTALIWIGMYSLLFRKLGIEDEAERLAAWVYSEFGDASRWEPYQDVIPAFERLLGRGLRLGVISNWDQRLEGILSGLGLSDMLEVVVSSACVGLRKPDPRIFGHACDALGVRPGEAVHVGDHHYADVFGASSAGMTPVLIDRIGAQEPGVALTTLDLLECELGWAT